MKKKYFFLLGFIFLLGIGYLLYQRFTPKKPNLIIISIDTLRADHVGVYGYDKKTTPNIDKWAKNGAYIFTNFYTSLPITYPSFASLMTGISPFESSIYNHGRISFDKDGQLHVIKGKGSPTINSNVPTLAEILKQNGYVTGGFVANSILQPNLTRIDRGFDYYNMRDSGVAVLPESMTIDAITWLEEQKGSRKPFFLWVHYLNPHSPYLPNKENQCKFNQQFCNAITHTTLMKLEEDRKKLQGCQLSPLSKDTIDLYQTLYDGELAGTDKFAGEILSYIHEGGFDKNTIVVIYGDHGEGFDHNFYFNHAEVLYESLVKIPFIIKLPGNTSSKTQQVNGIFENTQFFPSVLDLLSLKKPQNTMYKKSFDDTIQKGNTKNKGEKEVYYMNSSANKFAIRQDDYKYIYSLNPTSCLGKVPEELYNIRDDPKETNNLITSKRALAETMREKLNPIITKFTNIANYNKNFSDNEEGNDPRTQKALQEIRKLGY